MIVVPSTPTIVESQDESKWIRGTANCSSTCSHGGRTMNAVMMYAKSASVSHLNIFAIAAYGSHVCAAIKAMPKKKTSASIGIRTTR